MKYQWRKWVSIGPKTSKLVKVDGMIGDSEFDSVELAEQAIIDLGCYHDQLFENWVLHPIN